MVEGAHTTLDGRVGAIRRLPTVIALTALIGDERDVEAMLKRILEAAPGDTADIGAR